MWDDLVKTALVGTDKARLPRAEGPIGAMLTGDPEQALLGAGAALALQRQAGRQPERPETLDLPDVCPPEEKPFVGERAQELLTLLLAGRDVQLLMEWVSHAAAAGKIVLPEQAPALMSRLQRESKVHPQVASVVGVRGRWLAEGGKREFEYILPYSNPLHRAVSWVNTALSINTRAALFRTLRRQSPDEALEALADRFADETSPAKRVFLNALDENLSMADEPWLESLLDSEDGKHVQVAVVVQLEKLPQSRYTQRNIERMAERVRKVPVEGQKGVQYVLNVDLITTMDDAMKRDHLNRSQRTYTQERDITQMAIGSIPLAFWTELLDETPENLIRIALQSEVVQSDVLIAGWQRAALLQKNAEWARLLVLLPDINTRHPMNNAYPGVFDDAEREAISLDVLKKGTEYLSVLAVLSDHPWSAGFSQTVIKQFNKALKQKDFGDPNVVRAVIGRVHPTTIPQLIPPIERRMSDESLPYIDREKDQYLSVLHTRQNIHLAFNEE